MYEQNDGLWKAANLRQNISLLPQDSSKLGKLLLQNLAESTHTVQF